MSSSASLKTLKDVESHVLKISELVGKIERELETYPETRIVTNDESEIKLLTGTASDPYLLGTRLAHLPPEEYGATLLILTEALAALMKGKIALNGVNLVKGNPLYDQWKQLKAAADQACETVTSGIDLEAAARLAKP
ncbi:hypothetical protein GNI_018750 [Gregarina niphandrodes]|uniref:Uncharacterized protein n=1 Tax=Gregarina niphandrodes TaxID=110365 RepID=A0A023BC56_GRENI|nr:hypothetical protein GNI_018750 [Gregarina niphandrodes]EZG81606.1 hypothetical protein GNI_018750 [Gregarina niphandrodes]|eukprot:XP_011134221.1 hypothetical protein GNI_018750 [Gregarina niphandrodes]